MERGKRGSGSVCLLPKGDAPGIQVSFINLKKAITKILIRVPFENFSERQEGGTDQMRGQEGGDSLRLWVWWGGLLFPLTETP